MRRADDRRSWPQWNDLRHRRCARDDLRSRGRNRDRRHRQPGGGHPPRARLLHARQARGDGERRGRRARRPPARTTRPRGRRRLLARLRRPAGADLRDGRLGARGRIRSGRRRQGHEVPAGVPRVDAGHGLAALRLHAGDGCGRRLQRPDVQFLPRRHEERDRDGGSRERDGSVPCPGRPRVPAVRRRRSRRGYSVRATQAVICTTSARSR